ncbi:MAG: ATP-binding protein [bacterium]|nr:ATP-binding protein [bacterium]
MMSFFEIGTVNLPFFNQLAVLVINIVGISLVLTVVNHLSFRERITKLFIGLGILMLTWIDFAYLARLIGDNSLYWSELFLRIAWIVTPLFFAFVYLITIDILGRTKQYSYLNNGVIFIGLSLSVVTAFTDVIVSGVQFSSGNLDILYGDGFYVFLGAILFIIIATLIPLFRADVAPDRKNRVRAFVTGIVIFYVANFIFNILLPAFLNITHLYFFGDYSLVFVVGLTSYAILKYQFLNIRVIGTELITLTLWLTLFVRALTSENTQDGIINTSILVLAVILGILLIRSVLDEVKTRERMQKLALDLDVANHDLKRLDQAKSDFISIASHQLRTPLSIIKGYISMIREGTFGEYGESLKDPIHKVYVSTERLITLVSDLLDLSRMERGKMQYSFQIVNIMDVLEGLVSDFEIVARDKGLQFIWRPEDVTSKIKGDPNKLRQVVLNLIDNAVKYTRVGSVTVKLWEEKDFIKFSVTDTGPGLTEEEANKLFKKFIRGPEESKGHTEGLGLGLYVARLITEAHGGGLSVTSPGKGQGATFMLSLPTYTSSD